MGRLPFHRDVPSGFAFSLTELQFKSIRKWVGVPLSAVNG